MCLGMTLDSYSLLFSTDSVDESGSCVIDGGVVYLLYTVLLRVVLAHDFARGQVQAAVCRKFVFPPFQTCLLPLNFRFVVVEHILWG